jgi:hypothetical protein
MYSKNVLDVDCQTQGRLKLVIALYSYGHGISSVILLSIRKNLCSLSFIVIMTDIQNKNQNATSNVFNI